MMTKSIVPFEGKIREVKTGWLVDDNCDGAHFHRTLAQALRALGKCAERYGPQLEALFKH